MHVTRVELENIKSYERAEYTFERGTTAIVGPNGAGKTTILEAISWALFDTLEYSKDDFLRRGAKKGSVRVSFETDEKIDGRQYTVYRDTAQGYYVLDTALGMKRAEKKADVTAFLHQLLGIDAGTDLKALFRSAIGVPQGLLTADFRLTTTERKAKFDRLLKVEEYRESAKRLGDTANLIRERVAEVNARIARAEGKLARYDELVAEHKTVAERARDLTRALAALQREMDERTHTVQLLDEAELRVSETRALSDRLHVERDAAERRLRDLRSELDAALRARKRQRATEADYQAHLEALDELRRLESERAERDRLRVEAEGVARLIVSAEADVRRLSDALEAAARARVSLVELEKEIEVQEELERERERLRDLLASARAARERLTRLDRELNALRTQHVQTRELVRRAESARGAPEKVAQLESERIGVETELSKIDKALTTRKHLASQRKEQVREVKRLQETVASLERKIRDLEKLSAGAEHATQLEARERELSEQAAHLRAEIARDEKMRAEVKGGLCPILSERCLNIGEGQTLDGYFTDHLAANRAQLTSVQTESARVVKAVRAAREASIAVVQLDRERTQLAHERQLLAEREATLARIDQELATLPVADAKLLDELQNKLLGIDGALISARDEMLRYAELEQLRIRLKEIEEEGKRKKEDRAELAAAASAVESLTQDIEDVERRLRSLNDPRGRAVAMRIEAAREMALQAEAQGARDALNTLKEQKHALDLQLSRFKGLDAQWSAVTARREQTATAYREYLECASLAATVPARQAEVESAEKDASRVAREAETAQRAHTAAVAAYDREQHAVERSQLTLVRERTAATAAQLDGVRERESSLSAEIVRLDEVRDHLREEFRAKERLEELNEATDFMRDVLKQAGPLVTESYLYNISIEANQFFREITGDAERALRWSRDYEIILEESGYERSFVNLSGGEQMAAALSVRLALLKQLSDIRIAFFDEPTVNMDAERRENLARQIGQVRHFDQLFVISHDDTFEETVDHVVTVARDTAEAGTSLMVER